MTLKDGYEVAIAPQAMDNWELLEALRKIDKKEVQYLPDAAYMLLGDDGMHALMEHLRGTDGVVKTSDMMMALQEIIQAAGEDKDLKKS